MTQTLLDGTAETVSIQVRLDFIRKMEDSQTPIVFFDERGVKHLVYVTKVSYARPYNPLDGGEEPEITVVCVDAFDGLWQQMGTLGLQAALAYAASSVNQTNFVWGPAASDTFEWGRGEWE